LVEIATYGTGFAAARIAMKQIMDLKYTLRSLGVPIDDPASMFGDNQSVITSSTILCSSLNKRQNVLSYHRVCEAIASNVMFSSIYQEYITLTKALPWISFWPLVQPLLSWKGETVKAKRATPIEESIKADKLEKATMTGLRGVTSGYQVAVSLGTKVEE
jgi:hypothetical protein